MAIGTTAAILGSAALGAVGSIAGSKSQSKAAQQSANASQNATNATIAEQRRQFDIAQRNQQPWLTTGTSALNQLASIYGLSQTSPAATGAGGAATTQTRMPRINPVTGEPLPYLANPSPAANAPAAATATNPSGMAGFVASPDYQFRQNEQARALTARNSALGIQDSGAAQKAAMQYSGNLASGEFNNYANRLASLAGVGQTAANTSAQLGQNFAASFGNAQMNNAQNLSSSYQQQGANNANMYGNLAGIGSGLLGQFGGSRSATSPGGSLWGLF